MTADYTFPPIDREGFKPIYVQVADMIIDYANHLGLEPGDALPSENQLLAMLDVSRNSIRQAVDRLVKMDFAVKRRGQGTFIKAREQSINLDVRHGFEGTLHQLGIETDNILVSLSSPPAAMPWTQGLTDIADDNTVHIRRVKRVLGKIAALEDRILPDHIVKRYSREDIEHANVHPTLLDRHADTVCAKFKYIFVASSLLPDEAESMGLEPGTVLLQRIGEYYNNAGDCFMHGRLVFASNSFQVSYEFLNRETHWALS